MSETNELKLCLLCLFDHFTPVVYSLLNFQYVKRFEKIVSSLNVPAKFILRVL